MSKKIKCFFGLHKKDTWVEHFWPDSEKSKIFQISIYKCEHCGSEKVTHRYRKSYRNIMGMG